MIKEYVYYSPSNDSLWIFQEFWVNDYLIYNIKNNLSHYTFNEDDFFKLEMIEICEL